MRFMFCDLLQVLRALLLLLLLLLRSVYTRHHVAKSFSCSKTLLTARAAVAYQHSNHPIYQNRLHPPGRDHVEGVSHSTPEESVGFSALFSSLVVVGMQHTNFHRFVVVHIKATSTCEHSLRYEKCCVLFKIEKVCNK